MTVKLILLDVDGVLTDGTKTYGRDGVCAYKRFCDRDWTAIKRFKAIGVQVVLISGDTWNASIAEKRNLDFIHSRVEGKDKVDFLPEICEKYNVNPGEICYVGDDIFDIKLMRSVGYPMCPKDSPEEVRRACIEEKSVFVGKNIFSTVTYGFPVLDKNGGDNLIQNLFERLVGRFPDSKLDEHLNKVYELDKKEVF